MALRGVCVRRGGPPVRPVWPFASLVGRGALLAQVVVLLAMAGCSSGSHLRSSTSQRTTSTVTAPSVPPAPAGAVDCGETNQMAGWPTTAVFGPTSYRCILGAMTTGRPARMVIISPGVKQSGKTTRDGYPLPNQEVVTWTVLGPKRLQVITDHRQDGGSATIQICTGLTKGTFSPAPLECRP
ncbi:MAG: hypothetical protein JWM47_3353 [Acidimicrobiales bacterium]|nr:hypothetical protein [Acidimicrobiales bacterium]